MVKAEASGISFRIPNNIKLLQPDIFLKEKTPNPPVQCKACDFLFETQYDSILLEVKNYNSTEKKEGELKEAVCRAICQLRCSLVFTSKKPIYILFINVPGPKWAKWVSSFVKKFVKPEKEFAKNLKIYIAHSIDNFNLIEIINEIGISARNA